MADETQRGAGTIPAPADPEISAEAQAAILRLIDEIDRLRAEINANNRRIAHLEAMADSDPLTPTVNRRAFVRELERFKAFIDRYRAPASLVYLDIDGMKAINDRFGHAAGDAALLAVAKALVDNVRASDVVGRLGGDEFGVILAQVEAGAAEEKAAALAGAVGALTVGEGANAVTLSATWGVVPLNGAADAAAVLEAADQAMYARKRRPRA
jgi:diguanylate cyclase (GGDEF)-like protein